jgi:phenylalanyl-tRNA synthetase alpha chain
MSYTVSKLDDYSPEALDRAAAELLRALETESAAVTNDSDWKTFRDRWMARKNGILTQLNDGWLKAAPGPQKRAVGQKVNELKAKVEQRVESARLSALIGEQPVVRGDESRVIESFHDREQKLLDAQIKRESLDVTLPGTRRPLGAEHPITRTMNDIVRVFQHMGYSIAEGPEIETDYYNFESLNFPPNHPARDMQDTIFIAGQETKAPRDRLLLRTHTSPVQIRTMEKQQPPVRVVIPGRVYRNDAPDATHSPMFHQVEGLAVDTNITFRDLKGSLDHAMKELFGSSVKTRFRPSFFPFTEPSAEVLMSCIFCGGGGYQGTQRCPNCKTSGWIEMLGAGMVDPALYGFVGYDPQKVSGFAFGMGVDRLAAMLYGVPDLQLFFNGDVRFLEQFA